MTTQAKKAKAAKKPSTKVSSQVRPKIMLEVLWRPPKTFIVILAASLIFSAAGYAAIRMSHAMTPTTPNTPSANSGGVRPLKIMPLGDSVTVGDVNMPDSYRLALLQKMSKAGGRSVDYVGSQNSGDTKLDDKDHEGHSSWTTDRLNEGVTKWLVQANPEVILLQTGAADLLQGVSLEDAVSHVNLLLNTIHQSSEATVFVASLTPLSSQDVWDRQTWRDYNAAIPQIVDAHKARGMHVEFVDMQLAGITEKDMAGDWVFMKAGGYEKMAKAWYDALQANGVK